MCVWMCVRWYLCRIRRIPLLNSQFVQCGGNTRLRHVLLFQRGEHVGQRHALLACSSTRVSRLHLDHLLPASHARARRRRRRRARNRPCRSLALLAHHYNYTTSLSSHFKRTPIPRETLFGSQTRKLVRKYFENSKKPVLRSALLDLARTPLLISTPALL